MSKELKPCPFCGEPASVASDGIASCDHCLCVYVQREYWDTRPSEDALTARLNRIEQAITSTSGNKGDFANYVDAIIEIRDILNEGKNNEKH